MSNGDIVNFSVKELLGQQDKKLDKILDTLNSKADMSAITSLDARISQIERHGSSQAVEAAKELSELEKRIISLEKDQSDNRYLIPQYLKDHEKLENLATELLRLNNGIGTKIMEAIGANNKAIQQVAVERFTRKEKIYLAIFAGIGALGTLVSITVLILQVFLGG